MTPGSPWLVGAAIAAALAAAPAHAQTPVPSADQSQTTQTRPAPSSLPSDSKVSHWGVLVSGSRSWYLPSSITSKVASDGGGLTVVGSQFTIGIVRGRTMSGDWGVTFVHQPVKNGSNAFSNDTQCGFTNGPIAGGCFNTSSAGITQGVKMTGVEVHKFVPFALIAQRFQIGLEFGVGIAKLSGTVQKTSSDVTNVITNPRNGQMTAILTTTVTNEDVSAELPSKVPIGRLTVVGAVILNANTKLRWEGGMLFPGESFSTFAVTFLFGAR